MEEENTFVHKLKVDKINVCIYSYFIFMSFYVVHSLERAHQVLSKLDLSLFFFEVGLSIHTEAEGLGGFPPKLVQALHHPLIIYAPFYYYYY